MRRTMQGLTPAAGQMQGEAPSLQQMNPPLLFKHLCGCTVLTEDPGAVVRPPPTPSQDRPYIVWQGCASSRRGGREWMPGSSGPEAGGTMLTHVSSAFTPQAAARCGTTSPAGRPPLGARWSSWPAPSTSPPFKVRAWLEMRELGGASGSPPRVGTHLSRK